MDRAGRGRFFDCFFAARLNAPAAVRGFLRRVSGNFAEADDLAQEVFLAAWVQIERYRPDCEFRVWLCGIAYRKFLANRRGLFRRLHREQRVAEQEDNAASPHHEAWLDLRKAMMSLPIEQRAVAALCLAADWSHAEAAEALKLPLGTVKSHIQRGRAKLADCLSAYRPAESTSEAYEQFSMRSECGLGGGFTIGERQCFCLRSACKN